MLHFIKTALRNIDTCFEETRSDVYNRYASLIGTLVLIKTDSILIQTRFVSMGWASQVLLADQTEMIQQVKPAS
jgi:hypothetical protein